MEHLNKCICVFDIEENRIHKLEHWSLETKLKYNEERERQTGLRIRDK